MSVWASIRWSFWNWQTVALILKSPAARAVALIPFLSYTVLYSNEINAFFENDELLGNFELFEVSTRIHMLFLGALLLLSAIIIYQISCPAVLKRFTYFEQYASETMDLRIRHTLKLALTEPIKSRSSRIRSYYFLGIDELLRESDEFADFSKNFGLLHKLKTTNELSSDGEDAIKKTQDILAHWADKNSSQVYDYSILRGALTYLFEAHFVYLRLEKSKSAQMFCLVFAASGAVLVSIPTLETLLRVVVQIVGLGN